MLRCDLPFPRSCVTKVVQTGFYIDLDCSQNSRNFPKLKGNSRIFPKLKAKIALKFQKLKISETPLTNRAEKMP